MAQQRTLLVRLFVVALVVLELTVGCRSFTIRRDEDHEEVDKFYFPSDEALREFQQILLRELGLSRVPDVTKANITREQYDAQRRVESRYPESDPDDPDEDYAEDQLEYHQMSDDNGELRESVIIDHGPVRGVRRHVPSRAEWSLHLYPPRRDASSPGVLKPDGGIELVWSPALPRSRSARWTVRVQHGNDSFASRLEGDSIGSDAVSRWLDDVNANASGAEALRVTVTCHGRMCHEKAALSARVRLGVASGSGRWKRDAQPTKKAGKKKTSATSGHNGTNGKARHHPSHPKDILLGGEQQQQQHKKTAKSGGCSTTANGKKSKKCCPHSLVLNFRKVPGFEWILEPSEIDIFMCMGDCHYSQLKDDNGGHHPVNNALSNHAVFQAYLHKFNKKRVPKLCCTPSKLDSIQIVHYDPDDPSKLTTTRWTDAIVRECACA